MYNMPKKFHYKRVASAVSLGLMLSACGGSSDTPASEEQTPEPQLQSFSGKAADGYLSGALVCLDLNNNSLCDSDEPSAITAAGGNYEFSDLDATLDLSQVRLLVKVIADQTIDEDNPGVTVTQGYSLSSPPGQIDFVSPITTLIDHQMQNDPSQTQEQAEATVAGQLGIDADSTVDLTGDYVAQSDSASGNSDVDEYQRVYHVAQAVAGAIASVSDNLSTQIDQLDDGTKKDALSAIVENVVGSLSQITQSIDEAVANGEEVKVKDIIHDIQDTIHIAHEELHTAMDDIKDQRLAAQANIQEIATSDNGLYFLEQDKERFYNEEINKCVIEGSLSYGNFKVKDNIANFDFATYNQQSNEFELQAHRDEEDNSSAYILGANGWTLTNTNNENEMPVSFSEDGMSMTMVSAYDGEESITAQEIDIVGKEVANIARGEGLWHQSLSDSSLTFTEASKAYYIKGEVTQDHYIIPVWQGCESAAGTVVENCNATRIGPNYTVATSLEQLISTTAPVENVIADNAFYVHLNNNRVKVSLAQFTHEGESKQIASYYLHNEYCPADSADCISHKLVDDSDWEIETINGQQLIVLDVPDWLDDERDDREREVFISVQGEEVRQGFKIEAGRDDEKALVMNKAALDQVLAGFAATELRVEKDPEYCGVETEQKDETEGEGEAQPLPAPQIEADEQNTLLLTNSTYLLQEDDKDLLIRFKPDGYIRVAESELNDDSQSVEYGQWVVDANGKLLVKMGHDWMLFQVEGGLGEDHMMIFEMANEDGEIDSSTGQLELINLHKLTMMPSDIIGSQTPLTIAQGDQCSLAITLNASDTTKGAGFADASNCPDIAQDQGSEMFELLWSQEQDGLLTINPQGSDGSFSQTITMQQVVIGDDKHVVISMTAQQDNGEYKEDGFEVWHVVVAD